MRKRSNERCRDKKKSKTWEKYKNWHLFFFSCSNHQRLTLELLVLKIIEKTAVLQSICSTTPLLVTYFHVHCSPFRVCTLESLPVRSPPTTMWDLLISWWKDTRLVWKSESRLHTLTLEHLKMNCILLEYTHVQHCYSLYTTSHYISFLRSIKSRWFKQY